MELAAIVYKLLPEVRPIPSYEDFQYSIFEIPAIWGGVNAKSISFQYSIFEISLTAIYLALSTTLTFNTLFLRFVGGAGAPGPPRHNTFNTLFLRFYADGKAEISDMELVFQYSIFEILLVVGTPTLNS